MKWLNEPEHSELRRSFATWMQEVLLPARMPGAEIPKLAELQEVKSMLAERVVEWTQEWKQEGFEQGFQEGIEKGIEQGMEKGIEKGMEKGIEKGIEQAVQKVRGTLLAKLEQRFGPLPEETRRRVEAIPSMETLVELIAASGTAPSLDSLGLS